jgi:aminopeptidase N
MFKIAVLLLSLAAATIASPVELTLRERQTLLQADVDTKQSNPNYRLTDNVVPIHYDVLLHPYFAAEGAKAAFTFDGQVKILVKATQPNQVSIVLHANRLTVDTNWRVYEEGTTVDIPHPPYEYDEVTHKLTLNINRAMQMDINYVVELNFVGIMGDDMAGFYRSYYTDNGVRK